MIKSNPFNIDNFYYSTLWWRIYLRTGFVSIKLIEHSKQKPKKTMCHTKCLYDIKFWYHSLQLCANILKSVIPMHSAENCCFTKPGKPFLPKLISIITIFEFQIKYSIDILGQNATLWYVHGREVCQYIVLSWQLLLTR